MKLYIAFYTMSGDFVHYKDNMYIIAECKEKAEEKLKERARAEKQYLLAYYINELTEVDGYKITVEDKT